MEAFRLPKWQKDLKACWQKLQNGDYDWAHLALGIWPDWVKAACATDKSIAIAHGLEYLYKEPANVQKVPLGQSRPACWDVPMKVRDYIRDEVFGRRLEKSGCLVVYDPARRYRDIARALESPRCRVLDATASVIEQREAAMMGLQALRVG